MISADSDRKKILDAWHELDEADRKTLSQFAQFLVEQAKKREPAGPTVPTQPLPIPRPQEETVIKALKRLKKSYPMIEADMGLLDDASSLIIAKVLGTPEPEVIDRLEKLFSERFSAWEKTQNQ